MSFIPVIYPEFYMVQYFINADTLTHMYMSIGQSGTASRNLDSINDFTRI